MWINYLIFNQNWVYKIFYRVSFRCEFIKKRGRQSRWGPKSTDQNNSVYTGALLSPTLI